MTVMFGAFCAASAASALATLARVAPRAVLPVTGTGAFIVTLAALAAALYR
ncbi:hypothetical protein [Streptomyces sp. NPDC055210]